MREVLLGVAFLWLVVTIACSTSMFAVLFG